MRPPALLCLALAGCLTSRAEYQELWERALDHDADGYVNIAHEEHGGDDCDDQDAATWPGAPEGCDGRDNDCDGAVDEGVTDWQGLYRDLDGDGHGDPDNPVSSCPLPEDAVAVAGDCDDGRPAVNASQTDILGDGLDQNCDGVDGTDADADGAPSRASGGDDCDDQDPQRGPGAEELPADGVDQDCDGVELCFVDADADGWGADTTALHPEGMDCAAPALGLADRGGDCDDGRPGVHPEAEELPADDRDQDCDGVELCFVDADADGWGSAETAPRAGSTNCDAPELRLSSEASDCDDADPAVSPGALETLDCFDGVDNDCDGFTEDGCFTADGGALLVTEIFYAAGPEAAWFELSNESGGDLDLYGMELALYDVWNPREVDRFVVDSSLPLRDGERVVFCEAASSAQLGAACDLAYDTRAPDFHLTNTDNLAIRVLDFDGVPVDEVDYKNASLPDNWPDVSTDPDLSIELCSGGFTALGNDDGANWSNVSSSTAYRYYNPSSTPDDRYGTPGAVNTCE